MQILLKNYLGIGSVLGTDFNGDFYTSMSRLHIGSTTCEISDGNPTHGGGTISNRDTQAGSRQRMLTHRLLQVSALPGVSAAKMQLLEEKFRALDISESDIEEKFIRGTGKGGQKINKTSNCVQLIHRPSGIIIKCQKDRSRNVNRYLARCLLVEKLEGVLQETRQKQDRQTHQARVQSRIEAAVIARLRPVKKASK